eukprot:s2025_g11.t2
MATRFGTGKKTKHVELRFLSVQNLVQMGLLRMAKIDGTRNPADLMTKYVATDVLQRLKSQLGVVSNWFKGSVDSDAHVTDGHVAALNAHCIPRPPALSARSLHCALQRKGLSETISLPNEINVFPRNVFYECFLSATVDCSDCPCDCLLASTVAMANPALPTVPEVRYEELTGEQLAVDVAALSGLTVEEVRSDGVQASLIALHLTGGVPETRQDLIRLATGESFVRPTAFTRVVQMS